MPPRFVIPQMIVNDELRELLLETEATLPKEQFLMVDWYSSKGDATKRLMGAGFISATWSEPYGQDVLLISQITGHGREFLDRVRDLGVWSNIKTAAGKVQNLTPQMLSDIAKSESEKAGQPGGASV